MRTVLDLERAAGRTTRELYEALLARPLPSVRAHEALGGLGSWAGERAEPTEIPAALPGAEQHRWVDADGRPMPRGWVPEALRRPVLEVSEPILACAKGKHDAARPDRPDETPGRWHTGAHGPDLAGPAGHWLWDGKRWREITDTTEWLGLRAQEVLRDLLERDPAAFRAVLEQAYGSRIDDATLTKLEQDVMAGTLDLPGRVRWVDRAELGGADAAYLRAGDGTVLIASDLQGDHAGLLRAYLTGLGHHLDRTLGGGDAAGDEGAILALGALGGHPLDAASLAALRGIDERATIAWHGHDHGGAELVRDPGEVGYDRTGTTLDPGADRPDETPGRWHTAAHGADGGAAGHWLWDGGAWREVTDTAEWLGLRAAETMRELLERDPAAFRASLEQAYGGKLTDGLVEQIEDWVTSGELPLPDRVRWVDRAALGGADGCYIGEGGGTILLASDLRGDHAQLLRTFLEEWGHHLDRLLGAVDSLGDEGQIFAEAITGGGPLDAAELAAAEAEDDHGLVLWHGRAHAVEFMAGDGDHHADRGGNGPSGDGSGQEQAAGASRDPNTHEGPGGGLSGMTGSERTQGTTSTSSSGNSSPPDNASDDDNANGTNGGTSPGGGTDGTGGDQGPPDHDLGTVEGGGAGTTGAATAGADPTGQAGETVARGDPRPAPTRAGLSPDRQQELAQRAAGTPPGTAAPGAASDPRGTATAAAAGAMTAAGTATGGSLDALAAAGRWAGSLAPRAPAPALAGPLAFATVALAPSPIGGTPTAPVGVPGRPDLRYGSRHQDETTVAIEQRRPDGSWAPTGRTAELGLDGHYHPTGPEGFDPAPDLGRLPGYETPPDPAPGTAGPHVPSWGEITAGDRRSPGPVTTGGPPPAAPTWRDLVLATPIPEPQGPTVYENRPHGPPGTERWREETKTGSPRSQDYEVQVGGRPGQSYEVVGEKAAADFDGVKPDGTLIEAKGPGHDWMVEPDGSLRRGLDFTRELPGQLKRQYDAAPGRQIEWHVAEERVAEAIQRAVDQLRMNDRITVIHTPPRVVQ